MTLAWAWAGVGMTLALLLGYEVRLALQSRDQPERTARGTHARLREEWFLAVGAHPGSEVLAVQTLRNALMSATMTASTAALGLMGSVALAAPSLHATLDAPTTFTPRLLLELLLMLLLFGSLVASAMAVRSYNHASFIAAMPVGSDARTRWAALGVMHVRRAGLLYSWGLRLFLLVVPLVAGVVHPLALVPATAVLLVALRFFDQPAATGLE